MLSPRTYRALKRRLLRLGYGREIKWQARARSPRSADEFAVDVVYVICASGMRQQTARVIYSRVVGALILSQSAGTVFGHRLKCRAIDHVWANRLALFGRYRAARGMDRKLAVLRSLDGIGAVTVWHVAKNFGMDVAKPDRHLVRLAAAEGSTPQELCERLAAATGDRVAVVDVVLWRACNLRLLRPGERA